MTIHDHYSARRKLLTQAFGLFNVDGALSEGKLYCDKGYLSIKVEPQMRYDIRDDYKTRDLVLIGGSGTSFTITENPLPQTQPDGYSQAADRQGNKNWSTTVANVRPLECGPRLSVQTAGSSAFAPASVSDGLSYRNHLSLFFSIQ